MQARNSVRTAGGAIVALLLGLLITATGATTAQASTSSTDLGRGYSINLATGVVTAPGDDRALYVQVYDAAANHQTRVALASLAPNATTVRLNADKWAELDACQVDVGTVKESAVDYPDGPGSTGFVAGKLIAHCGHPMTLLTEPTLDVTPGTCTTPGTLTYTAGAHYTVTGTTSGTTGPADYSVTATAKRGFGFASGKTVTRTGSIAGKVVGLECAGTKPEPVVEPGSSSLLDCTTHTVVTKHWTITTAYVLSGSTWVLGTPVRTEGADTSVPAAVTACPKPTQPPLGWTPGVPSRGPAKPATPVVPVVVTPTAPVVPAVAVVVPAKSTTVVKAKPPVVVAGLAALPLTGGDEGYPSRNLLLIGGSLLILGVALRVGRKVLPDRG